MSFQYYEMKVIQWSEARKIIPRSKPLAQYQKLREEVDELGAGLAKQDRAETIDAVGDIVVCLINVCALLDLSVTDCLASAYEEIKDRKGHMDESGIFVKELAK